MNRKVPIRTYERKCKQKIIPLEKLYVPIINITSNDDNTLSKKNLNEIKIEEAYDKSMYYDPFDSTFDRLLKRARAEPRTFKIHSNESQNNIDNTSYDSSIAKRSHYEHSSKDNIKLSDTNMKLVSKQKVTRKRPKMQVVKKVMTKKNTLTLETNEKFKVKKYGLRKRKKKEITPNNSNIDSLHVSFESNICQTEKHHNIIQQKSINKKDALRSNKNSDMLDFSVFKIKSCSVVLNKSKGLRWKNTISNIKNNSLKEIQKSLLENSMLSKHPEIIKASINSFKRKNVIKMKHCVVKAAQLDATSNAKTFTFDKKYENVISSTPIDRPVRPATHLISLSPIPIRYAEKLNESVQCTDNVSTNSYNKDSDSLESKQMNVDLYEKFDPSEKLMLKEKTKLSVIYLTDTNCFKCSLNKSEELNKNTDSLIKLKNMEDQQQQQLTELKLQKLLNPTKNVLGFQMKENDIFNVSSASTRKCAMRNTIEKKCQLNFSVDVNRSHSLFNDTNESIQCLPHVNIVNTTKKSSINSTLDETNKKLGNNVSLNSTKLSKKSISNISSKVEIIYNNVKKEESCEIVSPIKQTSSDPLYDAIELGTKKVDFKCSDTMNVINESEGIPSKSNVLRTNDSSVDNDKSCNITESYVVLEKLQDPIKITKRRRYCKWTLDLVTITENCNNSIKLKDQIGSKQIRKSKKTQLPKKTLQCLENITEISNDDTSIKLEKPVYLKSGKSWARSLSILNSIQGTPNLDKLSIGKGKKWRYSVQDILNMQKQGIIQSCIRKNENVEELQASKGTVTEPEYDLVNNKSRTSESTSFGRLSKRISVRVIPICKTIKSIDDAPFLEVYGIIPVKGQKFSLTCDPRKSSLCNIQNDNIDNQIISKHITLTAKEVILERCLQKDYIQFSTYFSDLYLEDCRKIGEGVYGEVFLHEHEDKKSVIKIIPIEGSEYVNGEPQKKFHEILSEIVIAMELHNLRFNTKYNTDGFVEVKNIKCIKGKYPGKLIELWNIYDEEKHSDNDCPSMFNENQLYIILELEHGGQDLEAFTFHTAEQAYALFIQATLALAVAEKAVEFEHRDLHWGNILISRTNESHVHYKLGQQKIAVISKGVKVSIIDFTLSRVTYQGCSVFNDLASDPALFTAQGEYQFEIYRLMRDKIKNNWKKFEPYTNILWLHYTLDKMITAVRYRRKALKTHKYGIRKLEELKNEILTYDSAFDFVTNCDKIINLLTL